MDIKNGVLVKIWLAHRSKSTKVDYNKPNSLARIAASVQFFAPNFPDRL